MKTFLMLCLVVTAQLAGCAATSRQPGDDMPSEARTNLKRRIETRIVECTLPFMSAKGNAHGDIRYRYQKGSISFRTSDPALTERLQECAAAESGSDLVVEGKIQIWPADAS